MSDLGAFLFSLAIAAMVGYCTAKAQQPSRYPRPQRAPRTFRK
jgi:hypothetical protein